MRPDSEYITHTHHILELQAWGEELDAYLKNWANEDSFSLELLRSLDEAITKCDRYLTPPEKTLRDRMEQLTKLVVREHVQEVMKLLNEAPSDDEGDDTTLSSKDRPGHARKPTSFEELNSAAPEVRQGKLMEIYFSTVRRAVGENCPATLKKRTTGSYVPSVASRSNLNLTSDDVDGAVQYVESPPARCETPQLFVTKSGAGAEEIREKNSIEADAQLTEEIWCTLVFRMLCWLLLHDFHKKDVQISKSELFGSRLPVYIA